MGKYRANICVEVDAENVISELETNEKVELLVKTFGDDLFDDIQDTTLEQCYDLMGDENQRAWLVNQFGRFRDEYQQDMYVDMFDSLSRYSVQAIFEAIVDKLDSMQKQELRELLED